MSSSSAHRGLIINGRIGSGLDNDDPRHPGGAAGMRPASQPPLQHQHPVVRRFRPDQSDGRPAQRSIGHGQLPDHAKRVA